MIALGLGVVWVGYWLGMYGFTLLKGWDITARDLGNPIHPYQWPAKGAAPPLIPAGQILPGGTASTAAAGGQGKGGPPAPVI